MLPTTVTFYGDVGFDRSYNHVIDFTNETERSSYFNDKIVKTINDCAYNKPMNNLQIICDYDTALTFTYCKFKMGSEEGHSKTVYAWVDDVAIVTDQLSNDPTRTYQSILSINISIDPWQTFLFDFTIGESFVAREHVDRFIAHSDGTRGWTLPNTTDVGSLGSEIRSDSLVTFRQTKRYVNGTYPYLTSFDSRIYWLCIQYVKDGNTDPDYMQVLFVPVLSISIKVHIDDTNSYSTLTLDNIVKDTYLSILGIDPERVASVYYIPFDIGEFNYHDPTSLTDNTYDCTFNLDGPFGFRKYSNTFVVEMGITRDIDNFPYTFDITKLFTTAVPLTKPTASDPYSYNHEPQLFKTPYKCVSVIDENGIKRGNLPDICANVEAGFNGIKLQLLIDSVDVRLRVKPNINIDLDNSYWIEYSLTNVEVIRNQWLSYLLQERETTRQMIQSQINQQAIASAIGGVSSAVSMGSGQAMGVGKAQAGGSAAAAGMSELGGFGAGALVGLGVGAINTVGGYIANKHFGFEQQDIREKAIKNKANNITQAGTFKSLVGELEIVLTSCDYTTLDLKAKEFHKYGYSVFRYETPDIKSRRYFNFIATNIVKIEGALNNSIKMSLSEIFNNGVTIWHGDYISELTGIGDYSKENIERSLIT